MVHGHGHGHGYTSINTPSQTQGALGIPVGRKQERRRIFSSRKRRFICWGFGGQCRKSYAGTQETSPSSLFLGLKDRRQRTKEAAFIPQPVSPSYHSDTSSPQHIWVNPVLELSAVMETFVHTVQESSHEPLWLLST